MAGWATLAAGDAKSTRNETANRSSIPPTGIHAGQTLTDQTHGLIAGWATPHTPRAHDSQFSTSSYLDRQIPGPAATSSPAGTEKRGALNPALPRWLMGFPPVWCDCAVTATPSSRKSPRRS